MNIILDGTDAPIKPDAKGNSIPKKGSEFSNIGHMEEKILRLRRYLFCGFSLDKYNRISACFDAKEI